MHIGCICACIGFMIQTDQALVCLLLITVYATILALKGAVFEMVDNSRKS